jgi:hypothetical protein
VVEEEAGVKEEGETHVAQSRVLAEDGESTDHDQRELSHL